jgi:hypothetical protein
MFIFLQWLIGVLFGYSLVVLALLLVIVLVWQLVFLFLGFAFLLKGYYLVFLFLPFLNDLIGIMSYVILKLRLGFTFRNASLRLLGDIFTVFFIFIFRLLLNHFLFILHLFCEFQINLKFFVEQASILVK